MEPGTGTNPIKLNAAVNRPVLLCRSVISFRFRNRTDAFLFPNQHETTVSSRGRNDLVLESTLCGSTLQVWSPASSASTASFRLLPSRFHLSRHATGRLRADYEYAERLCFNRTRRRNRVLVSQERAGRVDTGPVDSLRSRGSLWQEWYLRI